jgi:long-chain fatty acid transport protein
MLAATAYPFGVTFAAGFQLFEQSVSSIATAGANQAAPDDATTAFYNPAAMVRLRGAHLSIAGTLIKPTGHFSVTEAQTVAPPPAGIPISGGSGGDPGSYNFLPSLFYTQAITDRLSVGLAMTSPFGLSTHYDNGWVGRYHALDSELATYEIAPQIAYALNEQWSLGFGVSAQYAKAKLSNAIDFSTVCLGVAAQVNGFGAVCAGSGLLVPGNQATDGLFSLKGTSWAYGWNAAVSYRATPTTQFGATFRSRLMHDLSADATFEKPASLPALIAGQAAFANGTAQTRVELPETATLSATTQAFEKWTLMAALTWAGWSRFNEIVIRFDNGAPDATLAAHWQDTVRIAIGASYRYNEQWSLSMGVAYDPTAIPDQFRGPRIPEQTRTILAFGGEYALTKQDSIGVGYQHQFQRTVTIDVNDAVAGTLSGNYRSPYIDVLALQYNHTF